MELTKEFKLLIKFIEINLVMSPMKSRLTYRQFEILKPRQFLLL